MQMFSLKLSCYNCTYVNNYVKNKPFMTSLVCNIVFMQFLCYAAKWYVILCYIGLFNSYSISLRMLVCIEC